MILVYVYIFIYIIIIQVILLIMVVPIKLIQTRSCARYLSYINKTRCCFDKAQQQFYTNKMLLLAKGCG